MKELKIVEDQSNPSKPELLDAFARANDEVTKIVEFVTPSKNIRVKIIGLDYESGSATMFNLRGLVLVQSGKNEDWKRANGFYNAHEKAGNLTIQD